MNPEQESLQREAAQWVTRMRSATLEERAEFTVWMLNSDIHLKAFAIAHLCDQQLREHLKSRPIELEPLLDEYHAQLLREAASPAKRVTHAGRRSVWRVFIATAAALLVVAACLGLFIGRTHDSDSGTLVTGAGEWHSKLLSDGSFVQIAPHTDLTIEYLRDRRSVRLARGEAMFRVAHNTERPFLVDTGLATARAVGTAFSVSHKDDHAIVVTVAEGIVAVQRTRPGIRSDEVLVHVDERVRVTPSEMRAPEGIDHEAAFSWLEGNLIFDSDPLRTAVREFNQFGVKQFVIADPSIEQLPVRGKFLATESEAFVRYLQAGGRVRAVATTPTTTMLYDREHHARREQ